MVDALEVVRERKRLVLRILRQSEGGACVTRRVPFVTVNSGLAFMRIAESTAGSAAADGAAPRRERKRGGRRGRQSAAAASAARAMLKANGGEAAVAGFPHIPGPPTALLPSQPQNVRQFAGSGMLPGAFPAMNSLPPLQASEQVAATEYDSFLNDLTFNSKDVINNLTKIAGENVPSFNAIAYVLEKRILLMPPPMKLPFLYLVDSICKNIGAVFVNRFRQGIGRCFVCAYECGTPDVRASMQRLLNTWIPVFGQPTVDAIRLHVDQIDNAPQVSGMPSPMVSSGTGGHLFSVPPSVPRATLSADIAVANPRGLGSSAQTSILLKSSATPAVLHVPNGRGMLSERATVMSRIESLFGEALRKASNGIPHAPLELRNLSTLISSQIQSAGLSPFDLEKLRNFLGQVNAWYSAQARLRGMSASTADARLPARTPHGAFAMGALPGPVSGLRSQPSSRVAKPAAADLSFDRLKTDAHAGVVRSLYADLSFVSKSDGMRFKNQLDLRSHLDWLFVQNKRKRARARTTGGSGVSRCWNESTASFLGTKQDSAALGSFSKLQTASGAAAPPDGEASLDVRTMKPSDGSTSNASEPVMCVARGDDETCPTCCEGFQSSWNDDKQAWMLVDAVRTSDDSAAYHSGCLSLDSPEAKLSRSSTNPLDAALEKCGELQTQLGRAENALEDGTGLIPNVVAVDINAREDGEGGLKRVLEVDVDASSEPNAKKARVSSPAAAET